MVSNAFCVEMNRAEAGGEEGEEEEEDNEGDREQERQRRGTGDSYYSI